MNGVCPKYLCRSGACPASVQESRVVTSAETMAKNEIGSFGDAVWSITLDISHRLFEPEEGRVQPLRAFPFAKHLGTVLLPHAKEPTKPAFKE